MAPVIFFSYLL